MSVVNGLNSYTNSMYMYSLDALNDSQNSSNNTTSRNSASTTSSISLLAQNLSQNSSGQTLTDQLSSLVKLTRYAMDAMGLENDSRVTFSKLQDYCAKVEDDFSTGVKEGLGNAKADLGNTTFAFNSYGALSAQSSTPLNAALTQLAIDDNPDLVKDLQAGLAAAGVDFSQGFKFSIDTSGRIVVLNDQNGVQSIIDNSNITALNLAAVISAQNIDPNINFTLKSNDDGSVTVNAADKKYTKVLQAFFDENPEIVKNFQRSEALSGIEDARKFLSLSPSEMRTRLQLESMVAWWDTSGSSNNSSFGTYTGGIFSLINGVNLSV